MWIAKGKAGVPVELGLRVLVNEDQYGFILSHRVMQRETDDQAINALEAHGLDRCPDHGLDGFQRYVALAVVGRNLHRLDAFLLAAAAESKRAA